MRIAQVLLSPRIGGAERLVETLSRVWDDEGDELETLYLDEGAARSRLPQLLRILRLRSALRRFDPDLVISHSALPNLFTRIAAPRSVRVIAVLHSAVDDFADRKLRMSERILRHRGVVVAVSEEQAATYRKHFPGADVAVIPNGVPADLPLKEAVSPQPERIVTLARVTHQKRPGLWLDVVNRATALRDLEFVWFGPIEDAPDIASLVEKARATGSRGTFAGPTDAPGVVLLSADILLHTASREAHSIGILEAAAVGLPVLCSREVAETLPDGLAVATFEDATGAVEGLTRVVDSWPAAARHAALWSQEIRARYSAKACAQAYKQLVRPKANRRPIPGRGADRPVVDE